MHRAGTIHIIFSWKVLVRLKCSIRAALTVKCTQCVMELNLNVRVLQVNTFPVKIKDQIVTTVHVQVDN